MDIETLLTSQGLLSSAQLEEATEHARDEGVCLAAILVGRELVSEDAFADAVARATGAVLIDLELGTLEAESVRLIPEADARRLLAVPVARGPGNQLRVAFANPLDPEPFQLITDLTGLSVDPVVATVSGILAVLDRQWRGRTTESMMLGQGRSDLPSESTRQLARYEKQARQAALGFGRQTQNTATTLRHVWAAHGTPEQRHEALLLTLIEKGALSRAEYLETLARLLGPEEDET